ncbi:MAG: c-type cytochrome [Bacteroidota bacterium]
MDYFKYLNSFLFISFLLTLFSCQEDKQTKIDTAEFILQDGFSIELVASEPLLDSPVAMQFDNDGRIWVVELPGYMRDIDGSDEEFPDGKIIILSDEDGDGQMDQRRIFLDSLIAPRTLLFAYNGLLYSENTNLWWTSLENDRPGNRILVDSLYVIGGNIEHQPNGLLYNLDNWIYSAKSNARYQLKNGKWIKEATTPRGQWGLTADDEGRLFYNDNSNPLAGDLIIPNVLIENKYQEIKYGYRQQIAADRRVFPIQATAVNRGYEEGVLDEDDKLTTFTSSCGPLIYRGHNFPDEYYGNAFVCGPEANLIKRYIIKKNGLETTAEQAYEGKEFLVSTDETFRPVNLYNGLDGALYIVDLRKGIIQHRAYMTSYLRDKILKKGLEKTTGIGRIYRIVSNKDTLSTPYFSALNDNFDLMNLLSHQNGEIRIRAQQELINNGIGILSDALDHLAFDQVATPIGQDHALRTYEGTGRFHSTKQTISGERYKHEKSFNQAILINSTIENDHKNKLAIIKKALTLNSAYTDLIIATAIGKIENEESDKIWLELATKYKNQSVFCEALISGISDREELFFDKLQHLKNDSIYQMLNKTINNKKNKDIKTPKILTNTFLDNRTAGFQLYNTYCLSCHGYDGKGNANLAPPLYPSEYVKGPKERLIALVLQGLKGPVKVNGKTYDMNLVMPGIKNNPELTDKKIADIITFVKNSFTQKPEWLKAETVAEIRNKLEGNEEMFTEESLNKWMEENIDLK